MSESPINPPLSDLSLEQVNELSKEPPPEKQPVSDSIAWFIVAIPVIGASIELLTRTQLVWLYILLNIGACILDAGRLRAAGHEAPTSWWALCVPVYLWKRAAILEKSKIHLLLWTVAFAISIGTYPFLIRQNIEDTACPLVTQIVRTQLAGTAECKGVTITEDVGEGVYRAKALLNNGRDLAITIEHKGDEVSVTVPPQ